MSFPDLFISRLNMFSGIDAALEKAEYVILGVPFDFTSTFRSGARFGPNAIRHASLNIETLSFRTNVSIEELKTHDLGDLHVSFNVFSMIMSIDYVCKNNIILSF